MAIVVTDASSGLYNWLKTATAASGIRALVYTGATNVLEEGDLTPEMMLTAFNARHLAGERSKVLAITVHDDGEKGNRAFVSVRIYDRQEGYRNIRSVRDLLLSVWADEEEKGLVLTNVNGKRRGLLFLEYAGRTGHFTKAGVDVEAIAFSGLIMESDE